MTPTPRASKRKKALCIMFGLAAPGLGGSYWFFAITPKGQVIANKWIGIAGLVNPLSNKMGSANVSFGSALVLNPPALPAKITVGLPSVNELIARVKAEKAEFCDLTAEQTVQMTLQQYDAGMSTANTMLMRAVNALSASANIEEKQLGLYMQAHQAQRATTAQNTLSNPNCKPADPCFSQIIQAGFTARATASAQLVALALQTNNPATYALALQSCMGEKTGACGTLSNERWAALDPNNAVPWLNIATQAHQNKDSAAQSAALQRAAAATVLNERKPDIKLLLAQKNLTSLSKYAWLSATAPLSSMALDMTIGYAGVGQYCKNAVILLSERQPICDNIATKLLAENSSTTNAMMAANIGKNIGWDPEITQAIRDEYSIGSSLMMAKAFSIFDEEPNTMFSCKNLGAYVQHINSVITQPDRVYGRELIANSGRSMDELIAQYAKKPTTVVNTPSAAK